MLHDLDREIEELEVSIREVNSQLKAASLKKQQKERTDKLARLRRELFVAEQKLQKSEEEGELNKQVAQRATIAPLSPMCQGQISFKKFELIQALMLVLVT